MVRRAGLDGLAQQRRVEGLAGEDPQVVAVGQRDRRALRPAASKVTASMTWPVGPRRGVMADELERPAGDPAAAGLFARMAAIDEGHARARPGQVARRHGARRSGSGDDRVKGSHHSHTGYRDQMR